jgi:hypothetical protein
MDRRYVGIDLHRRRSVAYAMDAAGERLFCERIGRVGGWVIPGRAPEQGMTRCVAPPRVDEDR